MTALFSTGFNLPYSGVNARGLAKADWLLNAFQDTASHQCHLLGISGFDMAQKGLKWVVAQYRIEVHDALNWLEPLTISTWRAPWKNLYEVRHFSIVDPKGKTRVTAQGIWILIKSGNGRPVRLRQHLPAHLMTEETKDPELIRDLPPLGRILHEKPIEVLYSDLDLNQHVNNSVYLRWALESMPHQHHLDYTPETWTISYLRECFYPETVLCQVDEKVSGAHKLTDHAIVRSQTREELARVSIKWHPCRGAFCHG